MQKQKPRRCGAFALRLGSFLALFADVVEHRSQPDKPTSNQAAGYPAMPIHGELLGAIEGAQAQHKSHHLANVLDANGSPHCSHLNFTRVFVPSLLGSPNVPSSGRCNK